MAALRYGRKLLNLRNSAFTHVPKRQDGGFYVLWVFIILFSLARLGSFYHEHVNKSLSYYMEKGWETFSMMFLFAANYRDTEDEHWWGF